MCSSLLSKYFEKNYYCLVVSWKAITEENVICYFLAEMDVYLKCLGESKNGEE